MSLKDDSLFRNIKELFLTELGELSISLQKKKLLSESKYSSLLVIRSSLDSKDYIIKIIPILEQYSEESADKIMLKIENRVKIILKEG